MPKLNQTPWGLHVLRWQNCQLCHLCQVRKQVVLARGNIPCDILYIGEAPGESEDVIGKPFVGPAGHLLDEIIKEALWTHGACCESVGLPYVEPRMAWTNIVACIPKALDTKRKNSEPLPKEIEACAPRLEELISMAKPKLIVAVGTLSEKQSKLKGWEKLAKVISIAHPAFLLRLDISQFGLQVQRCRVQLTDAIANMMEN